MARSTLIVLISFVSWAGNVQAQSNLCRSLNDLSERGSAKTSAEAGPLEIELLATSDPDVPILTAVSGSFVAEGLLQIANAGTNEIFIFDRNANRVRTIGGPGDGPGEFRRLTYSHTTESGQGITAFDLRSRRTTVFRLDGEVRSDRLYDSPGTLLLNDVVPTPDGGAVALTSWLTGSTPLLHGEVASRVVPLIRYDEQGDIVGSVAEVPGREKSMTRTPGGIWRSPMIPFSIIPTWLSTETGCIAWLHGRDPMIHFLDLVSGEGGSILVGGVRTEVTDGDWRDALAYRMEDFRDHPDESPFEGAVNPGSHQIASRLLFDGDRTLWLQAYEYDRLPTPGWWAMDLITGLMRWLPAPEGTMRMIAAEASGRIAVITMDDFDREALRFYRVQR